MRARRRAGKQNVLDTSSPSVSSRFCATPCAAFRGRARLGRPRSRTYPWLAAGRLVSGTLAHAVKVAAHRSHRPVRRLTALPVSWRRVPLEELDPLLSEDGWPYASTPPVEPGDLGRFHALFGRDGLICALQVMPAANEVARATLRALAARQGRTRTRRSRRSPARSATSSAPRRRRSSRRRATRRARRRVPLLRDQRRDVVVPRRPRAPRRRRAGRRARAKLARRRPLAGGRARARRRLRAPRAEHPRGALTQTGWRDTGTARQRRRHRCAGRQPGPGRRWPTPTARPSPTPRCARSRG